MSRAVGSNAPRLRLISLGAGVQSTTLALMAAHGEFGPIPDAAIFADTGWEPKAVYDHLRWLSSPNVLPFPVLIASNGNLRADTVAGVNQEGKKFNGVPWFTLSRKGERGMGQRQCTHQYKLRPIYRQTAELLHGARKTRGVVEMWIGISTDEAFRVRPARVQWITNRHPLIERRMSRRDCLEWINARGYPSPPKSACIGCPFRSAALWRSLPPDEFQDAVEVDRAIRNQDPLRQKFAHRSLVPLEQVDFSTPEERGQLDMFNNECEGMCGV